MSVSVVHGAPCKQCFGEMAEKRSEDPTGLEHPDAKKAKQDLEQIKAQLDESLQQLLLQKRDKKQFEDELLHKEDALQHARAELQRVGSLYSEAEKGLRFNIAMLKSKNEKEQKKFQEELQCQKDECKRVENELRHKQQELEQTKAKLEHTKAELEVKNEMWRAFDDFSKANEANRERFQEELIHQRNDLMEAESELRHKQQELGQTKAQLKHTKAELEQTKAKVELEAAEVKKELWKAVDGLLKANEANKEKFKIEMLCQEDEYVQVENKLRDKEQELEQTKAQLEKVSSEAEAFMKATELNMRETKDSMEMSQHDIELYTHHTVQDE
ncbi:tropomyosin-like isoform X1 [Entelurus aequoreus]|uniref:tropomyosin-like isoform X1 n=1 Tax=Entelurus aequoreus TaxID=161455 RepID=UPI002B1E6FBA|nr:tropomyosin-like isoform X1 [Entelurus aequoreus]